VDSRDFNVNLYRNAVAARFPGEGYKQEFLANTAPAPLPVDLSGFEPR
jgi:hypothetical protein